MFERTMTVNIVLPGVLEHLGEIKAQLNVIASKVEAIRTVEVAMAANLDDVLAQITTMKEVDAGMSAALDQIVAQDAANTALLKQAIASRDPVKIQAAFDALAQSNAERAAKRDQIVTAVTDNTVAETP
jgi:hypothetical protein